MPTKGDFEHLPSIKQATILSVGINAFSQSAYKEVSTDAITTACGISKGLLFHYFGSKRAFYLYCLSTALQRLTAQTALLTEGDFFEILFGAMDEKFKLCKSLPKETHFVNLASREVCSEIADEKNALLQKYMAETHARSAKQLQAAIAALPLNTPAAPQTLSGLQLYINAILSKYLITYQNNPDAFFANADTIKTEMKAYLQLMLNGIL
ncbi:MAG: TetR/AcrR family transcriptional regulator [Oscillospiraceae bacterium]|nr:TetR/AcrR family transcriptional regulator [Oscillospiraceae bacterium]